ncbi:MAG: glycosyltransferase family 1 protein [Calothrix sp. C42_A2020_038]|nr:glycosyltransferase family 1 protein [Calothrix sp. C42_A2020_038]
MANINQRVYFFIGSEPDLSMPASQVGYPHLLITLAEGLKTLGLEVYANNSYWRLSPDSEDYLFPNNPDISHEDCSIVVFQDVFSENIITPEQLFHKNRKYITAALEDCDGAVTFTLRPEYRKADFVFKSHFNSKLKFPSNVYPWAFGLSERIIESTKNHQSFQERAKRLLISFRHNKFPHSVRKTVERELATKLEKIIPLDQFTDSNPSTNSYDYWQWHRTGRRHSPNYYQRLKDSSACAAFGGFFVPAFPKDPATIVSRAFKAGYSLSGFKSNRIIQWDSWRFWESLASGCATFHVDFEKYGCQLPVMPENWRHYIGIDLDNIDEAISRIQDEPEILEKVSIEGKLWALENYSPVATAMRFLKSVGHPYTKNNTKDNFINVY